MVFNMFTKIFIKVQALKWKVLGKGLESKCHSMVPKLMEKRNEFYIISSNGVRFWNTDYVSTADDCEKLAIQQTVLLFFFYCMDGNEYTYTPFTNAWFGYNHKSVKYSCQYPSKYVKSSTLYRIYINRRTKNQSVKTMGKKNHFRQIFIIKLWFPHAASFVYIFHCCIALGGNLCFQQQKGESGELIYMKMVFFLFRQVPGNPPPLATIYKLHGSKATDWL